MPSFEWELCWLCSTFLQYLSSQGPQTKLQLLVLALRCEGPWQQAKAIRGKLLTQTGDQQAADGSFDCLVYVC